MVRTYKSKMLPTTYPKEELNTAVENVKIGLYDIIYGWKVLKNT